MSPNPSTVIQQDMIDDANPVVTVRLDDDSTMTWDEAISSLLLETGGRSIDAVARTVAAKAGPITQESLSYGLSEALQTFLLNPRVSTLVLSNTPVIAEADLPVTPWRGPRAEIERLIRKSDIKLLGIMDLIGAVPMASPSENEGRLFRNVIAADGAESQLSSHGSKLTFSWHMDNLSGRFDPMSPGCERAPDFLMFDCLRNHERVATSILANATIVDGLRFRVVRLLREPRYVLRPPQSNTPSPYTPTVSGQAIIIDGPDGPIVRYDPATVAALVPGGPHDAALQELKAFLAEVEATHDVVSRPGTIIIFKNKAVLHSRQAFVPYADRDQSRWLRRVYGAGKR